MLRQLTLTPTFSRRLSHRAQRKLQGYPLCLPCSSLSCCFHGTPKQGPSGTLICINLARVLQARLSGPVASAHSKISCTDISATSSSCSWSHRASAGPRCTYFILVIVMRHSHLRAKARGSCQIVRQQCWISLIYAVVFPSAIVSPQCYSSRHASRPYFSPAGPAASSACLSRLRCLHKT